MDLENCKKTFKNYVSLYNIKEPAISLKLSHSYRVMDLCQWISKNNNFNKKDIETSMLIGLLHDYARFEQWNKYKTYKDAISIDHGDLAVDKLFDNNEIINFCTDETLYDEIYTAIKYHNKLDIPDNLDEHTALMCNVIRDADKLDIFFLLGFKKNFMEQDDSSISDKISNDFYNMQLINKYDLKTKSDKILLFIAMIFDLNFNSSYRYIKEKKLINKMYGNINNKLKFKEYFDFANKYIDEKCKD